MDRRRTKAMKAMLRGKKQRPTAPTLSTLSDVANKFNFTATVTSEQLDFSKYLEKMKEKEEVEKMEVVEQSERNKEEEDGAKERELLSPFRTTRTLIGAVTSLNIDLVDEILQEQQNASVASSSVESTNPEFNAKIEQSQMNQALLLSITMQQPTMVKKLLEAGADMHAFDAWYPIILTAIDIKAIDIFEILLSYSKNVHVCSNYGSIMHSAARTGDVGLMRKVMELGVDLNMQCEASWATPLHEAVKSVRFHGKAWLHDASTGVYTQQNSSRKRTSTTREQTSTTTSSSAVAAKRQQTNEVGTEKMEVGDNSSDNKNNYDLTAVNFLINNGCKINMQDKRGKTPLHEASILGNEEVVQYLLASGAEPNIIDESSNIPLMYALQHNHTQVARVLMDVDKLNMPITGTKYYAHLASKSGNVKCLKYLLDMGASMVVIDTDNKNNTPLMSAINAGLSTNCAAYLLRNDTDCAINATNSDGETALDILLSNWWELQQPQDLFDLMIKKGADINLPNPVTGFSLLIKYSEISNGLSPILLNNNADPNFIAEDGNNVLLVACITHNENLVQKLLEHNLSMHVSERMRSTGDYANMTPLQISIQLQNLEITQLLLHAEASLRNLPKWVRDSDICRAMNSEEDNPGFYKVFKYIESAEHRPNSLQSLARNSIPKAVGMRDTQAKVEGLCLPGMIKSCLPWVNYLTCRREELAIV